MAARPRLAVVKFASCDGCQLTLLDCEDELLTVAGLVDIAHFAEAASDLQPGPYDVALVEGSITTPEDLQRLLKLRADSKFLVTIGACATAGGIQALRNFADHAAFMRSVYARPELIETLATSTPIAAHVPVDFELRGCPIDKHQLLEVLASLVAGRRPRTSTECVCQPCKRRGNVCVIVARGEACLGPVTQSGCGAICPTYTRGCYGCFGPSTQPNMPGLSDLVLRDKMPAEHAALYLRTFNANAPAFRRESERLVEIASVMRPAAPPTDIPPTRPVEG
jgi:coenzyme F420-reducing hydrogenase gamma subunit